MSSLRCGKVRFAVHPQDHSPRHVHGYCAETAVIVELREDGDVDLADRCDAIRPGNAKKSDVRSILDEAAEHFDELVALWEAMHESRA
jgi:Domain of unknown function (DUF4160)